MVTNRIQQPVGLRLIRGRIVGQLRHRSEHARELIHGLMFAGNFLEYVMNPTPPENGHQNIDDKSGTQATGCDVSEQFVFVKVGDCENSETNQRQSGTCVA